MHPKKQRDKNRRRAGRLAQEAWDAAEEEHFELAAKIIRRAVELNPGNPVLWHDQGVLLLKLQKDESAVQAFQAAIQVAPTFAEAYASLAAIRAREGKLEQAVTLQREAVRLAPDTQRYHDALAGYEALFLDGCVASAHPDALLPIDEGKQATEVENARSLEECWPQLMARLDSYDWAEIDSRLSALGAVGLPGLLDAVECAELRAMFDEKRRFAKTVVMNKSRFGKGLYRYFAQPIPPLVDAVRRLVYPGVAEIANRWQQLLRSEVRYPVTWAEFRDQCAAAGQTTPSPLMLSYEAGGFNALHQDVRGTVFFPIQLVVVLSPRAANAGEPGDSGGFTGGEFLLCDDSGCQTFAAGLGDAVLFCTCAKLVRVGAGYGLQPVKHGMARIESGKRFAVGIPFHEFR